ncbi:MAG: hypothetical protein GX819_05765, partial [Clostridiaceae bacterium]|nr:hypothetical protein [Clostridiaceae bacterium]
GEREVQLHDALNARRKEVGEKASILSNAIFPRDLLDKIANQNPGSLDELEEVMQDYPHRFKEYGPQILNLLLRKSK